MEVELQSLTLSEAELDQETIRRSGLFKFVKLAWPEVEANEFVSGWHIEQICNHLEAVTRGEIKRLIINVPPGFSKSTIVSVLWPAWAWIQDPAHKFMVATFDAALAWRDAMRCRRLIRCEWFKERWGAEVSIDESGESQTTQSVYNTTAGGRRISVTVGGFATGWHADTQIIDDPTKPRDVSGDPDQTKAALEKTWTWWRATMASRRSDPKKFSRVIIQQRLHSDDLVGQILATDVEHEWTHLMLPMRFEPERACHTKWGADIRTEPGELLCPARFDEASVKELERELGSQVAAAQLQQRPSPAGGNLFKREWFSEYWRELPASMTMIQSWDLAFKDTAGSDYCAGLIIGYARGKYYVIDRIKDRLGAPEVCKCIEGWKRVYPRAIGVVIEDKANGHAVEQILRSKVSGIIMWPNNGGKVAQANAASPLVEARNLVLPDPTLKPWVDDLLEELCSFPFSRYLDQTDALCQGMLYLHSHGQEKYLHAMQAVAAGKVRFG